jgi:Ca2+-binding EF-hand superfamily protein
MRTRWRLIAMVVALAAAGATVASAQEKKSTTEKPTAEKPAESHARREPAGRAWDVFIATFDADKDGKVSRDEFQAKTPGFDRLDTDKDGVVTMAEIEAKPAAHRHPMMAGFIARFDTNQDGQVSRQEWMDERMKAFDAADANHDGFVDATEAAAAGPKLTSGM